MIKPQLYLSIEDEGWNSALPDAEKISDTVMETVFSYVSRHHDLSFLPADKEIIISLCLSNDENVHRLNREFRGIDKSTNVLSFANIDDPDFTADCQNYDEIELGDIIIALETMKREAAEKGISFADHYCHLLTHGFLHILGFDHQEDEEAEYMEGFEINILHALNIANPYQE